MGEVRPVADDGLNFLHVLGRSWDEATIDDAEYFKEWRITETRNPSRSSRALSWLIWPR